MQAESGVRAPCQTSVTLKTSHDSHAGYGPSSPHPGCAPPCPDVGQAQQRINVQCSQRADRPNAQLCSARGTRLWPAWIAASPGLREIARGPQSKGKRKRVSLRKFQPVEIPQSSPTSFELRNSALHLNAAAVKTMAIATGHLLQHTHTHQCTMPPTAAAGASNENAVLIGCITCGFTRTPFGRGNRFEHRQAGSASGCILPRHSLDSRRQAARLPAASRRNSWASGVATNHHSPVAITFGKTCGCEPTSQGHRPASRTQEPSACIFPQGAPSSLLAKRPHRA